MFSVLFCNFCKYYSFLSLVTVEPIIAIFKIWLYSMHFFRYFVDLIFETYFSEVLNAIVLAALKVVIASLNNHLSFWVKLCGTFLNWFSKKLPFFIIRFKLSFFFSLSCFISLFNFQFRFLFRVLCGRI